MEYIIYTCFNLLISILYVSFHLISQVRIRQKKAGFVYMINDDIVCHRDGIIFLKNRKKKKKTELLLNNYEISLVQFGTFKSSSVG